LVDRTAAVIRAADGAHRPVTASLADTGTWPNFYRIADIDFINTHPYPLSAELDRQTVSQVRNYLTAYGRPVLIGESGLSAATPDSADGHVTVSDMAPAGIRHALWASVVSGAMNGRGWYWEDGFGIYFPELGMPFLEKYQTTERPAADFVQGVDFAGFKPVKAFFSPGLWGAVTGNDHSMIGWYRDAKSEPPAWPTNRLISGVTVSIVAPGASGDWRVVFIDTRTGKRIIVSDMIRAREQKLAITLPDFKDDIAFLIFKAAP
jgi:hypothetical protein